MYLIDFSHYHSVCTCLYIVKDVHLTSVIFLFVCVYRYRLLGKQNWETVHVTPQGSNRIAIRNLIPGKTYQFQVVGVGPHGPGEPSETVNITTRGTI